VDECAGVDVLVTNRVWAAMRFDPATTLHDVRWGEHYKGDGINEFVWLFQISAPFPASHLIGGYAGAISERQPAMYFRLGGGTLKGICKPGEVVWSRVFTQDGKLQVDMGRGTAIELPAAETERRWREVTYQWPSCTLCCTASTRTTHGAAPIEPRQHCICADCRSCDRALQVKATMLSKLGLAVHLCGV